MQFFMIAFAGYLILGGALVLNILAARLKVMTWYHFVQAPTQANLIDISWLFVVYPLTLGILAYYVIRLLGLTN